MLQIFFSTVLPLLSLTDVVLSSLVIQQTPKNLIIGIPEHGQAQLECYHGNNDYAYMYWYQHKAADKGQSAMELIGMLQYDRHVPEKLFEARFNITGHAKGKAHLIISNVTPADDAKYFCAASMHNVFMFVLILTKSWQPTVVYILYTCIKPPSQNSLIKRGCVM